ncbi:MAG TPA: hypothetical protein VFO55_14250 [Gemmatimonadaceae bacterium]|nr:hypothetical protein [Gemmatimonadaceae bacterium]
MSREFQPPRPSRPLMWALAYINRWFLLLGLPGLRRIPVLRDLPGGRGYFWLRQIDLPDADRERLQRAVNQGTAAFLAPNHPEFGFDWMMDKELSSIVAPDMASWASHDIIRSAPGFWLRNNLVSNTGGPAAIGHSVDCALAGHGVLLHPEGSVHWTGDKIHPLFNGIAEMACEAARRARADRPVYIVPLVWRLRYVTDIGPALHEEMERIEVALGLPRAGAPNVSERFRALQENILSRQMRVFGFDPGWVVGLDFFARQDAFRDWLIDRLESRYTVERCEPVERLLARYRRAIPREVTSDRARLEEAIRLCGFTRDVYAEKPLTQEQMAESLKRHRATLMRSGWRNVLHNYLPRPFGPRIAHVRVPEPIVVDPQRALEEGGAYVRALIATLHDRMQAALADTPGGARTLSAPRPPVSSIRSAASGYRPRTLEGV